MPFYFRGDSTNEHRVGSEVPDRGRSAATSGAGAPTWVGARWAERVDPAFEFARLAWRAASFPTHDPLVRLTSPSVGESAEAEVRLDSESARLSVRASRRHDESKSAQPEESKCARRRLSPRQDHRDL